MSKSVVLKICRGDSGDARLKCVSLGHVCTQKEEPQRHSERGSHRQERRKFRELKTVGVSSDADEIARLEVKARQWIDDYTGQQRLDFDESAKALQEARNTIARIERTLQNTPQVILGRIYDSIGFGVIGDSILRHLVIARVCQPQSKVATVEYLKSYFDEDVRLHGIYRYMDKLYNTQREKVQQISVGHTMRILGGRIGIVFYDVTTLYFESCYFSISRAFVR